jgi:hypothetical protein
MLQNNPLKQYFRQPSIYIKLPSNGEFYPEGSLDMPPNNEIPVYPMTAMDEITYRTPDALFNGSATVNVIQSCIPNIKQPWAIPAVDVDTILVGIRIASYGHSMEVTSQCPNCQQQDDYSVDLRTAIDTMKGGDYRKIIRYRDLEIYFKPMSYRDLNNNNQRQYDEQRTLQSIAAVEATDQEKIKILTDAMKKLQLATIEALSQSIAAIKTPNALVTETEFIVDLLQNCDSTLFNQIRDHIVDQKIKSELQPMKLQCHHCKHNYNQALTLDMTSFFAPAS